MVQMQETEFVAVVLAAQKSTEAEKAVREASKGREASTTQTAMHWIFRMLCEGGAYTHLFQKNGVLEKSKALLSMAGKIKEFLAAGHTVPEVEGKGGVVLPWVFGGAMVEELNSCAPFLAVPVHAPELVPSYSQVYKQVNKAKQAMEEAAQSEERRRNGVLALALKHEDCPSELVGLSAADVVAREANATPAFKAAVLAAERLGAALAEEEASRDREEETRETWAGVVAQVRHLASHPEEVDGAADLLATLRAILAPGIALEEEARKVVNA